MQKKIKITISLPCWGRPLRTIRAIECICQQNINGWEALVVGDGCPVMQQHINEGVFDSHIKQAEANGNILSISNNKENKGGCGYSIINANIQAASGEYFVFFGNDDIILPNHFENYLSGIQHTDLDFSYFDSYVEPYLSPRISDLKNGSIGHSELIIRTSFLRQMPPHNAEYGHDWVLIRDMLAAGARHAKAQSKDQTYIVKGVPNKRTDIID